jgi:hypothetical protein
MTTTNNPTDSPSLSILDAMRRRRQLLASHALQPSPEATGSPAEEEPQIEEESGLASYPGEPDNTYDPEDPPYAEDSEPASPLASPPPTLTEPALYGLAGLAVRSLAPHTEADPAAILLQFLAAFGNLVGPTPHSLVGSTRHGLNLFVILVGESSKARKGTSWRQISSLFAEADPLWASRRVTTTRPTANSIL